MEKFEVLEKAMCKEMEAIEQKLKGGTEMSVQDLDRIDKLAHAMKSLVTYKAMKEAEEYNMSEDGNISGARGRSPMTGRYISRDPGYSGYGRSYDDGYSGHYPMMYPAYPEPRRW